MNQPDKIVGRDIIIVGQQAWDTEIGSNIKNIAKEFCKTNRVLYVNAPLDRKTKYSERKDPKIIKRLRIIKGQEDSLIPIQHNLWIFYPEKLNESINWIKNKKLYTILNRLNNRRFASSIEKALEILSFKNTILFNDNDIFRCFYLKELLKPTISIYYSRDYMLGFDYWKRHGEKLEPQLIAKSDICLANSTYLTDYCKKYNKVSYYVGQGCELEMFTSIDTKNIPEDIRAFIKPIIGYVGALNIQRLDIEVIEYIAETNPGFNIVLVGPQDEFFKKCRLHLVPNIYFLGSKDIDQLPYYINAFDICINPQKVNEVTIGNYPRKIDEYLALGKPVVATKTDGMKIFSDHTYIAETKEEFTAMIKKALEEDNAMLQSARKKFVSAHSWQNCVKEIYTAINSCNSTINQ